MTNKPLLDVRNLIKHYPVRGGVFKRAIGVVHAVEDVSFQVYPGETLGLVGESGCGKSTLGRTIMRLENPTDGHVYFDERDLANCNRKDLFHLRRDLQMIFQDPYASLNPRMTIGDIVREPLIIHKIGKRQDQLAKVSSLLEEVGLRGELADRYPHEFSGGQRQRVCIARALALEPKLLIADEPVSALDVSVQAQVINLMVRLQKELNLTYIFISHDLSVVEYISDRIAIMYLGRIVEIGTKDEIFNSPAHPYTRALLESIPIPDPEKRRDHLPITGEAPSSITPPSGCAFHPRCPHATEECKAALPQLTKISKDSKHQAACIRLSYF